MWTISLQSLSWFNEEAMNLNDIASIPIKGSDYTIHFWYMNMDDAITIMKNSDLNFKKWNVIIFFITYKNRW